MFLVVAATATTSAVIALGLIRRLFTPDHRLFYLPAPADRLNRLGTARGGRTSRARL